MDSVFAIGLELSLREISESSLDELREYSHGKSRITQKSIKISKKVKAALTGDFEICSMPQLEQDIIDSSVYSWVWNIKPKSPGTKYLNLDIVTIIEMEGKTTTRSIKVFHEPMAVVVKEKPKSWLDHAALIFGKLDLKWIYGTFLLPLFLYVWKRLQEKRKKGASKKKGG